MDPMGVEIVLDERSCSSHLFRHASEITKETKGGYLEGSIAFSPEVKFPIYARLSLLPSMPFDEKNPFMLHPNLLHVNMKMNKRKRKLQEGELPEDVDWMVLLKIQPDGSVYKVCPFGRGHNKRFQHSEAISQLANSQVAVQEEKELTEAFVGHLRDSSPRSINLGPLVLPHEAQEDPKYLCKVSKDEDGARRLTLGSQGLMLNVITPLQKVSRGGATIADVLQQRFQDVFHRGMSSELKMKSEEIFTKSKEDRVRLQLVRLLFEVFECNASLAFQTSDFSNIITNSKSKECGPIQLSDINPDSSCTNGNSKVFLLSFFKLVPNIRPAFILIDPHGEISQEVVDDLRSKINQPESSKIRVFNQSVIVFPSPAQDPEVIREIRRKRLQLRITAYRPSDGRMSSTSFRFFYHDHDLNDLTSTSDDEDNQCGGDPLSHNCTMCKIFQFKATQCLPLARPGVARRKNEVLRFQHNEIAIGQEVLL